MVRTDEGLSSSVTTLNPSGMKAAQYVRMSTEHQKYSIDNQIDAIAEFAIRNQIQIVKTYLDKAKSGLSLKGRPALVKLLQDVQAGNSNFDVVLVYDVSRWGRFQDTDESAHYEFLCKSAGVAVRYCMEQFGDDGLGSSLLKVLKRAMAAEYSRDLSIRTFAGHSRAAQLGLHATGTPSYGLRRILIDRDGSRKCVLEVGQRKNIREESIGLGLGPVQETEIVRRIFDLFVAEKRSEVEISEILNRDRIPARSRRGIWLASRVHHILTNENYIGNVVYGRRSRKLRGRVVSNPPDTWIRCEGAVTAIVDKKCFRAAQERIARRQQLQSNSDLLVVLQNLYKREGRLSASIIKRSSELPCVTTIRNRFGGLLNAYALLNHPPPFSGSSLLTGEVREAKKRIAKEIVSKIEGAYVKLGRLSPTHLTWTLDGQASLRVTVVPASRTRTGSTRWMMRGHRKCSHDFTLVVRLDRLNRGVLDYYLLPGSEFGKWTISLGATKRSQHEDFRISSLGPLLALCFLQQMGGQLPKSSKDLEDFLTTVARHQEC